MTQPERPQLGFVCKCDSKTSVLQHVLAQSLKDADSVGYLLVFDYRQGAAIDNQRGPAGGVPTMQR